MYRTCGEHVANNPSYSLPYSVYLSLFYIYAYIYCSIYAYIFCKRAINHFVCVVFGWVGKDYDDDDDDNDDHDGGGSSGIVLTRKIYARL